MSFISLAAAVECLRDAAHQPDLWPTALPLIAHAAGGIGAACFVVNDRTEGVEWAHFCGPATQLKDAYVEHFAPLDPYAPVLASAGNETWLPVSDALPEPVLRHSEWYNDFILPCGMRDAIGVRLLRAGSRQLFLGIHLDEAHSSDSVRAPARQRLLQELRKAAPVAYAHRTLSLKAALGDWMLGASGRALFVTYDDGRIAGMNQAAEAVLAGGHALRVRRGRLVANAEADNQRFQALMMAAAGSSTCPAEPRHLLLGDAAGRPRHVVTAWPLNGGLSAYEQHLVMIAVDTLLDHTPPRANIARLFGLSPAEERLAQGLLRGRTLHELTGEFGLKMPTLRAQLRSVFRKCGVGRQADLLQVLRRAG